MFRILDRAPDAPGEPIATVRVRNSSNYQATTIVRCNVPVAPGLLRDGAGTYLYTTGTGTEQDEFVDWTPFGPVYNARIAAGPPEAVSAVPAEPGISVPAPTDGHRYATVSFPVVIAANSTLRVPILIGQRSPRPRALGPNLTQMFFARQMRFEIQLNGVVVSLLDAPPVITYSGDVRLLATYGQRVPTTPYYVWLTIELNAIGQEHLRFWIEYGNSDPTDPLLGHPLTTDAHLYVLGARVKLRHPKQKELARQNLGEVETVITLMRPGPIGDGNGQCIEGVLSFDLFPNRYGDGTPERLTSLALVDHVRDVRACSTDWSTHGTYGPFGVVPPRPPWIPTVEAAEVSALAKAKTDDEAEPYNRAGPWARQQYGMFPNPGNTGAQPDFGLVGHWWAARTGEPDALDVIQRAALQDYCRWINLLEHNLAPKQWTNQWWLATEHEFRLSSTTRSPDMRGKDPLIESGSNQLWWAIETGEENNPDTVARNWCGRDIEHNSMNCPTFYQLLAGDPGMARWVDGAVERWKAHRQRGTTGNPVFDGPGGARRSVGRTMVSGLQLYLLTGRADILDFIQFQVEQKITGIFVDGLQTSHLGLDPGDQRSLPLDHITPWQDAFAVYALWAYARESGNATALNIAKKVARAQAFTQWHDRRTVDQYLRSSTDWTGSPQIGETITGLTSGATGTLWLSFRAPNDRRHTYLHTCTGQFQSGETIRGNTSTATLTGLSRIKGWQIYSALWSDAQGRLPTVAQSRQIHSNGYWAFQAFGEESDFSLWGMAPILLGLMWAYEAVDIAWSARCLDILGRNDAGDPLGNPLLKRSENVNDPWSDVVETWAACIQNPPWVGE